MKSRLFSVPDGRVVSHLLPIFAGVLTMCLAAWLAVDLFWRVFSPRPAVVLSAVQSDPVAGARGVAGRHVMGAAPVSAVVPMAGGWALTGLTTSAPGHPGFAVLAQGGGMPQGVREGEEIAPGVLLNKILPDAVELSSGGAKLRVKLKVGASVSAAANSAGMPPHQAVPLAVTPINGAVPVPANPPVLPPVQPITASMQ